VIKINLPPLRERPEDIPLLAAHFAQKYWRGAQTPQLSPEALELLLNYSWPGNVRQLENAMERACVTARDDVILPENLPAEINGLHEKKPSFSVDLARPLQDQVAELTAAFEERYLRRALKKTRGHVGKCAEISGLSRRSVTDKIAQYQIDKEMFKKDE
jgi:DNA-binding NtrC family response regulator